MLWWRRRPVACLKGAIAGEMCGGAGSGAAACAETIIQDGRQQDLGRHKVAGRTAERRGQLRVLVQEITDLPSFSVPGLGRRLT